MPIQVSRDKPVSTTLFPRVYASQAQTQTQLEHSHLGFAELFTFCCGINRFIGSAIVYVVNV